MSDDLFTNSDSNAASSAGFDSPLSTGQTSAEFGGPANATQPTLTVPAFDAVKSLEAMQRVRDLNIKPFGDNPPPTVLTPNMLALTPQLADKYPDIYNPTLFAKSMDTYGPRWGMDRATVLKTASNTDGGENQGTAATPPQTGQENAHRPDEDFTHNGVGYYRRDGQLYSAGSDDPNLELKVTPEVEAKIMKERANEKSAQQSNQASRAQGNEDFTHNGVGYYRRDGQLYSAGSDDPNLELKVTPEVEAKIMKERAEYKPPQFNSVPEWQENAMPGSDNHDFLDGVFAMPDGDNPYEGKNLMQQAGRLVGSKIPAWDEGRKTAQIGYGMWDKHNRGEEITSSDVSNLTDHALETVMDLGTYTGTGLLLWAGRKRAISEIKHGYHHVKNIF